MTAVKLPTNPSSYEICSEKSMFILANTYETFFLSKKFCLDRQDEKMLFLSNHSYHILQIRVNEELPQKMDSFCFWNQNVDCLNTLISIRLLQISAKRKQVFDSVQRVVYNNEGNTGVDRGTNIIKKKLLSKKL